MSFTVDDFNDLLRLLEQHPEWRAELRRQVLTDELQEMPALLRQLTERVDRLGERVEQLAEAQQRTEERLQRLEGAVERLEGAMERLEGAMERLEGAVERLVEAQGRTETRLGAIEGLALEQRYRTRAGSYFGRIARRLRVIENTDLADMLDDAADRGQVSPPERDAVMLADLVIRGRRRDDAAEVYLLVEVSATIDASDVTRAHERSAALAKLGVPVIPVVAGNQLNAEAMHLAAAHGVVQALDGHIVAAS